MSPYDEGRTAAASGGDNPYADGTYHHAEWLRGFGHSGDDDAADTAFDEGSAAGTAGDRSSNPYDGETEEDAEKAERWSAGFASINDKSDADEAVLGDLIDKPEEGR